ncbi:MAG: hypothetical protein JZU62_09975, partial [Sulfuricurvum sp.]|uniref:hypothetical protein n=1 Tax=Sulfuricurvum sp. TaxID=2025608 RepID=UPI0025EFCEEC
EKAQAMVTDASSKNFVGKNEIQTHVHTARPVHKTVSRSVVSHAPIKSSAKSHDDDVWENF